MWRRLTLAGTQRQFQFPAQPFGFLLEALGFALKPVILLPELLVLLLRPFQLSPGDKVDGFSWFVTRRPPNWSHPPYGSRKGGFCPAKTSGNRIQDVLRLVNKYFFLAGGSDFWQRDQNERGLAHFEASE